MSYRDDEIVFVKAKKNVDSGKKSTQNPTQTAIKNMMKSGLKAGDTVENILQKIDKNAQKRRHHDKANTRAKDTHAGAKRSDSKPNESRGNKHQRSSGIDKRLVSDLKHKLDVLKKAGMLDE